MWKILLFFLGSCRIRITGGSPAWALERLAAARIPARDVQLADEFCIEASIPKRDAVRAEPLCAQAMCAMEVLEVRGFSAVFGGLRRRWIFAVLLAVIAAAGYFVPKFVFFYRVSGNERVPAERILRELQDLGVGFGTYGPSIRPQELKNQMLLRIPELQWLTVTQNGMCAEVVVRERPEAEPVLDRKTPQNVVASRAGVVTQVLCYEGNCLVTPGQAVEAGQLLVSAYTDLEFKTQVSAANAEVYAKTIRRTETVIPDKALQKTDFAAPRRQISLLLGKKRVKLWGNSGNSGMNCDKITRREFFTLPGGYFLPVGLEIVTVFAYDTCDTDADPAAAREALEQLAAARIRSDLIAGTAESLSYRMTRQGGLLRLETRAECEEMIARREGLRILPAAQAAQREKDG